MESCERSSPVEPRTNPSSQPPKDLAKKEPAERSSSANPIAGDLNQIDAMIDDPEATWYVRPPSGGQYGPADSAVLRQWIDEGRVAGTALLWRDGWPQWRSASETLPGLAARLPGKSASTPKIPEPHGTGTGPTAPAKPSKPTATNHAFRDTSSDSHPENESSTSTAGPTQQHKVVAAGENVTTDLSGDQTIGTQRRQRTHRRILMIGMLSSLAVALLGALYFLMNR